jgi:PTS system beta-glucosides-specific IIC component
VNQEQLATRVAELVGGPDNVTSVTTCATRLRFVLKNPDTARLKELGELEGVIQALKSGSQTQVVIGTDVADVHQKLVALPGWRRFRDDTQDTQKGGRPLDRLFDFLSGTFQPLLYPLMGAAMVKLILTVAEKIAPWDPTQVPVPVAVLTAASNALFFFLPIFVGITASRKLGANPFLGGVIAAALLEPSFVALGQPGSVVDFLGAPLFLFTYSTAMVPALLSSVALAYVERGLKRVTPKILDLIVVPTVALLVLVPLSALVIGPLGVKAGEGLATGITWMSSNVPLAFYIAVGVGWVFMVMLGLHWALLPLVIQGLATTGESSLFAAAAAYQFGMIGVALGVTLKSHADKEVRALSSGAFVAAIVGGITEPTLYGLVLRYRRVLVAQLLGAFAASLVLGTFAVTSNTIALSPILGIPAFSPAVAYVVAFVLGVSVAAGTVAWLGYREPASTTSDDASNVRAAGPQGVHSPLTGTVVPLADVADPIFSAGLLGPGVAIEPSTGVVLAPVDGRVIVLPPSAHAVGIRADNGDEILVHIGIDTVKLKGEGFIAHVQNGDVVRVGDPLVEFDRETIQAAGYSLTTPVVVTNAKGSELVGVAHGAVAAGDTLFEKLVAPVEQAEAAPNLV